MSRNRFAVIGVGRYGTQIANKLSAKGAEVFAFDNNLDRIENIKENVALAVQLDTTDQKAMLSQKINEMDAAVVAIGENFEATILTVMNLLDFKVPRVIVRASGENQKRILKSLGIEEILAPEEEFASLVAEQLINPNITAFLQLPDNYEVAEIKAPRGIANRSLEDIDLVNKYNLTLITIKRCYEEEKNGEVVREEHILGVPRAETVVYTTDTLIVFGTLDNVKRFLEING
ncbi:potassium channel family protein [Sanyastnella coralliicola]|uniref:potassium channel family protein n=1 Tax=Sanyastnella coralliicola TaxID=3069118 RepID=UPI0027BAB386|nr:TrkA family potassium uptake protein [Longitalea sp. SCSIO 12813]